MSVIPTDVLTSIASELNISEQPLILGEKRYRPTVFQERESKHYVCCFVPISIMPTDYIDGLTVQYENYLKGGSTNGYIFFKHQDPKQLKDFVINWYRNWTN